MHAFSIIKWVTVGIMISWYLDREYSKRALTRPDQIKIAMIFAVTWSLYPFTTIINPIFPTTSSPLLPARRNTRTLHISRTTVTFATYAGIPSKATECIPERSLQIRGSLWRKCWKDLEKASGNGHHGDVKEAGNDESVHLIFIVPSEPRTPVPRLRFHFIDHPSYKQLPSRIQFRRHLGKSRKWVHLEKFSSSEACNGQATTQV
ncbi:hypothetical protein BDP27DRAFT_1405774 [Rhodocollybia butyracea]|uniref:Uncharacterized protein n=1 Tax=Rhodocollybia butyracea TaxID=206335 RepID=A0A9P5PJ03_9AGAR|nr:hypothetical protein BDP27DRAFT_1405774 [Rhodocollybia butyracea]